MKVLLLLLGLITAGAAVHGLGSRQRLQQLQILTAYAVRLKPVYLDFTDCTICQLQFCRTLQLPLATLAVSAHQIAPDVHATACCDGYNVSDYRELPCFFGVNHCSFVVKRDNIDYC